MHAVWTIFLCLATLINDNDCYKIKGQVTTSGTQEPIALCFVSIEGANLKTTTTRSGHFTLSEVTDNPVTLLFEAQGYQLKKLTLQKERLARSLLVSLTPLNEVSESMTITEKDTPLPRDMRASHSIRADELEPVLAEPDLFRSLQALPGITATSDYSAGLHIRGGTPDQNLYWIEGAELYDPEHAFGVFSVFNTQALSKVDLYNGGFGVNYGARLSSVLDIDYRGDAVGPTSGSVSLGLISLQGHVETPLAQGMLSTSLRRTYFDQTHGKRRDDVPDYHFFDGHVKYSRGIGRGKHLTVFAFGSSDELTVGLNEDVERPLDIQYSWGNQVISARWRDRHENNRGGYQVQAYSSRFRSDLQMPEMVGLSQRNRIEDVTIKARMDYAWTHWLIWELGGEAKHVEAHYQEVMPGNVGLLDLTSTLDLVTAYLNTTIYPTSWIRLESGVRVEDIGQGLKPFVSPRVSAHLDLTHRTRLSAAAGQYMQFMKQIPRMLVADIWAVSDANHPPSQSSHLDLSLQHLTSDLQITLSGYHRSNDDIYTLNNQYLSEIAPSDYVQGWPVYRDMNGLLRSGKSRSHGMEFLIEKNKGVFNGHFAYSYQKTRIQTEGINLGEPYDAPHDQTHTAHLKTDLHVLDLIGKANARGDLVLNMNVVYGTGLPITEPAYGYNADSMPGFVGAWNYLLDSVTDILIVPGSTNGNRSAPYMRADLGLVYRKTFQRWSMMPFVHVFNVGDRENAWFSYLKGSQDQGRLNLSRQKVKMMPRLPSIGLKVKY